LNPRCAALNKQVTVIFSFQPNKKEIMYFIISFANFQMILLKRFQSTSIRKINNI